MKILLDTNFILTCVKQKIDFDRLANEVLNEKIDWILPQEVLNELGNIKDKRGIKQADKDAAGVGFELLQKIENKPEVVEIGNNMGNIDISIVNYIFGKDIALATLDRGLKNRIDNKILTIRGKNSLELI